MNIYKDPDKLVDVNIKGYEPFIVDDLRNEDITVVEDESNGSLIVRAYGENHHVEILSKDFQQGTYVLRVNGKNFNCQIETNLHLLIKELGFNRVSKTKEKEIIAPMPGMVLNTQVKNGDTVSEGQVLLTLEAMKMENIIKAPHNGIIEKVLIKKGDKVEKNQILLRFE